MDQPQGHQDAMRILTRRQIGDAQPIMHWISENTSREAIFLVDPTLMSFYLVAERSMFVSFKHVPTSPVDILEWYDRIQLINNSENPKKTGFDSLPELQKNFEHLSRDELITLTNEYFLDYYLSRTRPELALDEVQSIDGYTLYSLSDVDP